MGFGETGKVAFVHKSFDIGMSELPDSDNEVKKISKVLAGKYGIGTMTQYLGIAQLKTEDTSEEKVLREDGGTANDKTDDLTSVAGKRTDTSTFAGAHVG